MKINTLYQSLKRVTGEWHDGHFQWTFVWSYIRFIDSERFIYAQINGEDLALINQWFNEDAQNCLRGTYNRDNDRITLFLPNAKANVSTYDDGILVIHWAGGHEWFREV